jgi:hypothetical protein
MTRRVIHSLTAMLMIACSESSSTTGPTLSNPPENISAALVDRANVNVTWTARPKSERVTTYVVYRDAQEIGRTAGTSFVDSTAPQQMSHKYSVSSVAASGFVSEPSASAQVTVPDATPPRVLSAIPRLGATLVDWSSQVHVIFSEAIDPATLTSSTIVVKSDGAVLEGALSYVAASNRAIWTPAAPMPPGKSISVTVATGVKDVAGNALKTEYSTSFTTKEKDRPFVTGFSPPSGSTDVSVYSTFTMTFNERMDPNTLFRMTDVETGENLIVLRAFDATGQVATLSPFDFNDLTTYDVYVDSLSAKDIAGNSIASVPKFRVTFGNDFVLPKVTSVSPADGATGVTPSSGFNRVQVEAQLDKPSVNLDAYKIAVELRSPAGDLLTGGGFQSARPSIIWIAPVLQPNTRYTVELTQSYTDRLGHTQSNVTSWSFTTAP